MENRKVVNDVVETFLNTLIKEHPSLKNNIASNKDALLNTMRELLIMQKPELDQKDLRKGFLEELTTAFVGVITQNNLSHDPNKNFTDRVKDIFANKPELVKEMKELMEEMKDPKLNPNSPEYDANKRKDFDKKLEKLSQKFEQSLTGKDKENLHSAIKNFCAEMLNDQKKVGLFKPKDPQPGQKKPEEEMTKNFTDKYTNLFGLVCAAITGSHPAVVQCFLGNGLGFNDWNPNSGSSQIDLENKTDDTQYGDPLARNASAMANYLKFTGGNFVNTYQQDLQENNVIQNTQSKSPTPFSTTPNPYQK